MKNNPLNLISIIIFLSLILNGCVASFEKETPEKLAQSVVNTLIEKDKNSFEKYAFPEKNLLLKSIKDKLSESERKEVEENYNKMYEEKYSRLVASWNKIHSKAEKDGVNWGKVSYVRAEYKIRERKDFPQADIYVFVSDGKSTYEFKIDDAIQLDDNWYAIGSMRWYGKVNQDK